MNQLSPESSNNLHGLRRWFRFSLRTLLFLVVIVAAVFSTWIVPSERQRRFCEELHKLNGSYHFAGEDPDINHEHYWYEHYYRNVERIEISNLEQKEYQSHGPFSKLDWATVPKLSSIDSNINLPGVDDELFAEGVLPKGIKDARLVGAVTDKTIQGLSNLAELEALTVHGFRLTDEGVAQLAKIPKLKRLTIRGLRSQPTISRKGKKPSNVVTVRGFAAIGGMQGLERFCLECTEVSDEKMEHIAKLQNLRELRLFYTPMSQAAFAQMLELKNLESLDFESPYEEIQDEDIKQLCKLKKLKKLRIGSKKLNKKTIEELQAVIPYVEIDS